MHQHHHLKRSRSNSRSSRGRSNSRSSRGRSSSQFQESNHPRDSRGRFTSKARRDYESAKLEAHHARQKANLRKQQAAERKATPNVNLTEQHRVDREALTAQQKKTKERLRERHKRQIDQERQFEQRKKQQQRDTQRQQREHERALAKVQQQQAQARQKAQEKLAKLLQGATIGTIETAGNLATADPDEVLGLKNAKGVKVYNLKPSQKSQKCSQKSTPEPVKAEPRIRPHEVPIYDAVLAVLARHKPTVRSGEWDEQSWLDDLGEVFTEHFADVARTEVQRHIDEDWPVLKRYGIERDEWASLFDTAMQQWVAGYVPELLDLLRQNNARFVEMGLSPERLAERLCGQARAETIAITEYTSVVGATQAMITALFNEVMSEVRNGTD
jgi:hypothetical protein